MTRNLVFIGLVLGTLLRALTGADEAPRASAAQDQVAIEGAAAPYCAVHDPLDDAQSCL